MIAQLSEHIIHVRNYLDLFQGDSLFKPAARTLESKTAIDHFFDQNTLNSVAVANSLPFIMSDGNLRINEVE